MPKKMPKNQSKNQDKPVAIKMFSDWQATYHSKTKIIRPILIEGMPGIGNVGKIAMDIIIEQTSAIKFISFFSHNIPNSVFVNEDNLIDLPKIVIYYKRIGRQDFLFMTGDVQPTSESSSYDLAEFIVQILGSYNCSGIVTLGGIGLANVPESPRVFITGNTKRAVEGAISLLSKKKLKVETKIYGVVGPIIGISGLLLGISKRHDIDAFSLLAETFGYPVYVGLKGSREILKTLDALYGFKLNLDKIGSEILAIDNNNSEEQPKYRQPDVNYIG